MDNNTFSHIYKTKLLRTITGTTTKLKIRFTRRRPTRTGMLRDQKKADAKDESTKTGEDRDKSWPDWTIFQGLE